MACGAILAIVILTAIDPLHGAAEVPAAGVGAPAVMVPKPIIDEDADSSPRQRETRQQLRRQRMDRRLQQLRFLKARSALTEKEKEQLAELEEFKQHHTPLQLKPARPSTRLDSTKPRSAGAVK